VARRIDQIQLVLLSVARLVMQANAFGLDGDAALAFEIHRVEKLRMHFALGERPGQLEKAVGQRGFAMVDVCDDAEIPDVLGVHVPFLGAARVCRAARVLSDGLRNTEKRRFRG